LARLEARDLQLALDPLRSFVERDLEIVLEVVAAARARPPAALSAAKEALEEVFEDGTEPDVADAAAPGHGPEPVVSGPLVGIRQNRVRLADLLEALLGLFVAGVFVRMVRPGEIPVGPLQFGVIGVSGHTEHAIVVLGGHGYVTRREGQ